MSPFRLNLSPSEPRECIACGKFLPARFFPNPVTQPSGYVSVIRRCKECANAARRKGPGRAGRPPKRNAAGLYHCCHCRQYFPAETFGKNRGKPAAYCRPCARKLDAAIRRKVNADPEWREAYRAKKRERTARYKRDREHLRRQRIDFAHDALMILRKRGLTNTHICRLGGFSRMTLVHWERKDRAYCWPGTVDRLSAIVRATAFLPNGTELAYRTFTHPEWNRIVEELRWEMAEA